MGMRLGKDEASMLSFAIDDFNANLNRARLLYIGRSTSFLREVALDVLARVVEYTPVDTGRAACGWFEAGLALGDALMVEQRANEGSSTNPGEQELGKDEGDYREGKTHSSVWIELVNGVPYILALEFGSSSQGGHAMVQRALAEVGNGLGAAWTKMLRGFF